MADPETGLFHNWFRDYDPRTGRYVQSDPIGLGGGWNTYGYVGANPLSSVDKIGLSERDVQRFRKQFYESVNRMTEEGVRHRNPRMNNRYGQWDDTLMKYVPFIEGNPLARRAGVKNGGYEVCSGQTRVVASDLFSLLVGETDDVWTISNPYSGSHYWLEAVSSNPSDVKIIMDPWLGTFTTLPRDWK